MQVTTFPFGNDLPAYTFKTSLTNVQFTMRVRFNTRMQRWIVDVADPANNDILNGMVMLIDLTPWFQYVIPNLPAGQIIALDNRNNIQDQPTRNSFGTTHTAVYVDPTS